MNTVGTAPKYNSKIDTPNTHKHDCLFSWLGAFTFLAWCRHYDFPMLTLATQTMIQYVSANCFTNAAT